MRLVQVVCYHVFWTMQRGFGRQFATVAEPPPPPPVRHAYLLTHFHPFRCKLVMHCAFAENWLNRFCPYVPFCANTGVTWFINQTSMERHSAGFLVQVVLLVCFLCTAFGLASSCTESQYLHTVANALNHSPHSIGRGGHGMHWALQSFLLCWRDHHAMPKFLN